MGKNIKFNWSGKTKQICRVNGVIIGFLEDDSYGKTKPSWRWDSRFHHGWKPNFNDASEGRKFIEDNFTKWHTGIF